MGVWLKLVTAVRGGANEAAEAVADSQALRILDQEIRDAESEISKSEHSLTSIIAKQKLSEKKVHDLMNSIAEHEGYAAQALSQGNEALALEIAEKIADLEQQNETESEFLRQFEASAGNLRHSIQETKKNMRRMKQQIDTVKATQSVQKAQTALASKHLGANSKMKTATESLERIKAKQAHRSAELEAASELALEDSGGDLKAKMAAAGITGTSSGEDVLSRLKAKQVNRLPKQD